MSIYDKSSLVLIPSGTKSGKVFSQKPVNGDGDFTFSRSTAATRVNADGNIEKETQNLLLQSNNFDTTWGNTNTTETGGQTGYDGSNDAWLLNKSADFGRITQSVTNNGVQTYSVYAKAGSLNYMRLRVLGTLNAGCFFDFTDGSVPNNDGFAASMVSVGGGWYRCSYTFDSNITEVQIFPANSGNSVSGGSGNIYIQDAQLEQGLVARDYIETTTAAVEGGVTDNVPRLDYTDSSCPALLLEPQRTNHYHQSEYFSTGSRAIITNNATTSPEGVSNATSVVATSVSGSHEVTLSPIISIGNTNPRTFSLYAKYNGNHLILNVAGSSTAWTGCIFDLQNGVAKTPENNGSQSLCTASIEDAGDGWYRCSVTYTPYASGGFLHLISLTDDVNATLTTWGAASYVGDDVSGIYIYGAQVEEGSYATSYIPTYGTSVTRNADSCSVSNIGDLINNDAGTFYVEIQAQANDSDSKVLTIGDGTSSNRVQIFYHLGTNIRTNIISNGSSQVTDFTSAIDQTNNIKVLIRYANNNAKMFLNGVEVHSDTSVTTPTGLDVLRFNNGTGGSLFFGYLRNLIYIPTSITDQEAIDLTTI